MNHSNTHRMFITLYASQATQTEPDNAEAEANAEGSDFPPCQIGIMSPISSHPLPVTCPSRYLPKATASGVQQPTIIVSSSEEPEEPSESHCSQRPNIGLVQANILNTAEANAEDSDFPPCQIGNMSPISSCPLSVTRPSCYLPKATSSGVQQPTIIISSSEEPEELSQSHHSRRLNIGLHSLHVAS